MAEAAARLLEDLVRDVRKALCAAKASVDCICLSCSSDRLCDAVEALIARSENVPPAGAAEPETGRTA